jgi:uracil-DNA glycosylase
VTKPSLVLPLGLIASASCLEVTLGMGIAHLEGVAGLVLEWPAPWGCCWVLPLYHPSPANGGRWPRNMQYLREFVEAHPGIIPQKEDRGRKG